MSKRQQIKKTVKRVTVLSFATMIVSGAFVLGAKHGQSFRNFKVVR